MVLERIADLRNTAMGKVLAVFMSAIMVFSFMNVPMIIEYAIAETAAEVQQPAEAPAQAEQPKAETPKTPQEPAAPAVATPAVDEQKAEASKDDVKKDAAEDTSKAKAAQNVVDAAEEAAAQKMSGEVQQMFSAKKLSTTPQADTAANGIISRGGNTTTYANEAYPVYVYAQVSFSPSISKDEKVKFLSDASLSTNEADDGETWYTLGMIASVSGIPAPGHGVTYDNTNAVSSLGSMSRYGTNASIVNHVSGWGALTSSDGANGYVNSGQYTWHLDGSASIVRYTWKDGHTGDTIDTKIGWENDGPSAPAAPKHDGYNFTGWTTSNDGADVIITANYEAEKFTVTFEPGEHGAFDAQTSEELVYGDETPAAPDAANNHDAGWTFAGWNEDVAETVTGSVTYIAQWTKDESVKHSVGYTVKYHKDNIVSDEDDLVSTETWIGEKAVVEVDKSVINLIDKYVGYKCITTAVPDSFEVAVGEPSMTNYVIDVFYVNDPTIRHSVSYKVEYYKDGELADTQEGATAESWIGEAATVSVDKSAINLTDKYVGYECTTKEIADSFTVDAEAETGETHVIRVDYSKDESAIHSVGYMVEYYKDGVKIDSDTQTATPVETWIGEKAVVEVDKSAINLADKYVGYKCTTTEVPASFELAIGDKSNTQNIIKVEYVKDEGQTQDTSYTVKHVVAGVEQVDDTKIYTSTAWINDENPMIAIVDGSLAQKTYTGYKFDSMSVDEATTAVSSGTTITLNYVKDERQANDLSYTVKHIVNGTVEDIFTGEKKGVWVNDPQTLEIAAEHIADQKYVGYTLQSVKLDGADVKIGDTVANGSEIVVTYAKDETQTHKATAKVNYYYGITLDDAKAKQQPDATETDVVVTRWVGDEAVATSNANTSDKFPGYKFAEQTGSAVATAAVNAKDAEEILNVYYIEDENVTITYKATTGGSVNRASESLAPVSGAAQGSIASPAPGYKFTNWTNENGDVVGTDFEYRPARNSDNNLWESATYTANFVEADPITINYVATAGGSVDVVSETILPLSGTAQGSTAAAAAGYHFVNWTDANGQQVSTDVSFVPEKVEGVNTAATYTANFAEDDEIEIRFEATTGGSVSRSSQILKPATGTANSSIAEVDLGYRFVNWTDAAGNIVSTDEEFTPQRNVNGIYETAVYTAHFAKSSFGYTVTYHYADANGNELGTTIVSDAAEFESTIPYSIDEHLTYNGQQFAFDSMTVASPTVTSVVADNTIDVYYGLDEIIDPSEDNNGDQPGDGTPDKYQATVDFAVNNGSFANDFATSQVLTFSEFVDGQWQLKEVAPTMIVPADGTDMVATEGYGRGSWLDDPAGVEVKAGDELSFIYAYIINEYTVTVNFVDEDGNVIDEAASITVNHGDAYDMTDTIPATVINNGTTYVLDATEGAISVDAATGDATITATYAVDAIGDNPDDPTNPNVPDGIADKYQAVVNYVAAANGSVDGATIKVITLMDGDDHATQATVTPGTEGVFINADEGYAFNAWDNDPAQAVLMVGGNTYTYTASFSAVQQPTPDDPTPDDPTPTPGTDDPTPDDPTPTPGTDDPADDPTQGDDTPTTPTPGDGTPAGDTPAPAAPGDAPATPAAPGDGGAAADGGAGATVEIADDGTPLAAPEETTIEDDANPLAHINEPHCWTHWLMILGMIATIIYGLAVVARRNKTSHDIDDFEDTILGNNDDATIRNMSGVTAHSQATR